MSKPQDYEYWNAAINLPETDNWMREMADYGWEVLSANGMLYPDGMTVVYILLRRLIPDVKTEAAG